MSFREGFPVATEEDQFLMLSPPFARCAPYGGVVGKVAKTQMLEIDVTVTIMYSQRDRDIQVGVANASSTGPEVVNHGSSTYMCIQELTRLV